VSGGLSIFLEKIPDGLKMDLTETRGMRKEATINREMACLRHIAMEAEKNRDPSGP